MLSFNSLTEREWLMVDLKCFTSPLPRERGKLKQGIVIRIEVCYIWLSSFHTMLFIINDDNGVACP